MADEQAPRDGENAEPQVQETAPGPEEARLEKTSSAESRNAASEKRSKAAEEEHTAHPGGTALEKVSTTGSKRKGLEERSKGKIVLIMAALSMATFLAALDATIISTALPTIASELQVTQAEYTWIGSAYTLACAASTPPWGKISDIFGRKPILLVANVIFFIGSLLCGVSVNIDMLVAGRAIQGVGAGGLLSLVNICIGDMVSLRNRGAYYGVIGGVWALAGGLGPVLGGVFTTYVTWRWCFYVNLPCDGAAFLVLLFFLDIETPKTPLRQGLKAIDWLGIVLITGGVIMFLIGLETGGVTLPWASAEVICLIVFGLVVLAIFLIIEWKVAKYPMMPLRLFQNRSRMGAFGTCFAHGIVFIAGSYYLPLYFQAVLSATPLLSGVYQLAFVGGLGLFSLSVGIFIRKTGRYREPIWLGMFLMTLGFGLFIDLPDSADWARIVPFQIIAGLGTGPNFQAPLIALQNHIEPKDMATATATFAFTRNLASSIGIVIGGVIFQNRMNAQRATLLTVLDPQTADLLASGSAGASVQLVARLPPSVSAVVHAVYAKSLSEMWIFFTVVAFCGFCVSLLIGKKELSKQHQMRKQGLEQQEADRQEELAAKRANGKSGDAA